MKLTAGAVIHTIVALVIMALVVAGMWPFHGLRAGVTAGAMVGIATFLGWEIGQSRVKSGRQVRWSEALYPAAACLLAWAAARIAIRIMGA